MTRLQTIFCRLQPLCLLLAWIVWMAGGRLHARVIEPSAIAIMQTLSKHAFDQRYPHQPDFDPNALAPAWYVVYKHYNVAYYFGPIRWQVTAWDYQGQLEQLLQAAVLQRPSIVDYELAVQYLPQASAPVRAVPRPAAPEEQTEPWWLRFRRIFF
jgi:hypothetical protein